MGLQLADSSLFKSSGLSPIEQYDGAIHLQEHCLSHPADGETSPTQKYELGTNRSWRVGSLPPSPSPILRVDALPSLCQRLGISPPTLENCPRAEIPGPFDSISNQPP